MDASLTGRLGARARPKAMSGRDSGTRGLSRVVLQALLAVACGDSGGRAPPPPADESVEPDPSRFTSNSPDERNVYARGSCVDGSMQTCRVYLPAHNGVQPCFVGVQQCISNAWGDCEDGVLVDANASDAEIDPQTITSP